MKVTDYDMICRGSSELARVYRGDHTIVWEPGDWYVEEVTGGTLVSGVDYLFGFVIYDPNQIIQGYMYAYQWTFCDVGGGSLGTVDYCLPINGSTERKLNRNEYEYYFGSGATYSTLFNIVNGKFQLKGTSQYLSLQPQQSTPDLGRLVQLDATGKPFLFGAETGQDVRLVDNGIEFAFMYGYNHPNSPYFGFARRYPSPICEDYTSFVKVYRLVRHR